MNTDKGPSSAGKSEPAAAGTPDTSRSLVLMLLGGLLMVPGFWALLLLVTLMVKSDPLAQIMTPVWLLCVALAAAGVVLIVLGRRRAVGAGERP